MEKQSSVVIAEVEDFIKRVHNGDLVITPKANKLFLTIPAGKNVLGLPSKRKYTLADLLGWAMAAYQLHKDFSPPSSIVHERWVDSKLKVTAYEFLDYIERARACGVIKELNITNKLKTCQEQNNQLKERIDKLESECQRLKKLNQVLHETLGKFGRSGNIGDVKNNAEE